MSNPFPLSPSDASAFFNDVTSDVLYGLPLWGAIIQWRNRYVLVYPVSRSWFVSNVNDFRYTDVTGGIPDTSAPAGMIPISTVIRNVPKVETPTWQVFLYSIPSNFLDIAKEDLKATGNAIGDAIQPLIPSLSLTAIIVMGILVVMYLPRPRG